MAPARCRLPAPVPAPEKWDRFAKIRSIGARQHTWMSKCRRSILNRPFCCYKSDTRAWLWTAIPCRKSPPVTAPSRAEGSTFLSFLSFFLFPPSSLFPFSFLPLSFLLPPLSSLAFLSLLLFLPSSLFPSSSPSSPLLLFPFLSLLPSLSFPLSFSSLPLLSSSSFC